MVHYNESINYFCISVLTAKSQGQKRNEQQKQWVSISCTVHRTAWEFSVEIDHQHNEKTEKRGHCFGMRGVGTLCHKWPNIWWAVSGQECTKPPTTRITWHKHVVLMLTALFAYRRKYHVSIRKWPKQTVAHT